MTGVINCRPYGNGHLPRSHSLRVILQQFRLPALVLGGLMDDLRPQRRCRLFRRSALHRFLQCHHGRLHRINITA